MAEGHAGVLLGGRGDGLTRAPCGALEKGKKYFTEHELFGELFQNSQVSCPAPWPPRYDMVDSTG